MQGQVVKSVWNGASSEELAALLQSKQPAATQDGSSTPARLPSKYALRWAVIGFCAAFWGTAAILAVTLL